MDEGPWKKLSENEIAERRKEEEDGTKRKEREQSVGIKSPPYPQILQRNFKQTKGQIPTSLLRKMIAFLAGEEQEPNTKRNPS